MHECGNGSATHLPKAKNLAKPDGNKVKKNIERGVMAIEAIVTKPIRFKRNAPNHLKNIFAVGRKATWKQNKKGYSPKGNKRTSSAAKQSQRFLEAIPLGIQ